LPCGEHSSFFFPERIENMENFKSRVKQPWTTYDNQLIQGETIFKSANQKLCYMYLYSYANASKIFPSIDTISKAICCKRRATINVIAELESMGMIEVIRTPGKSNQYILNDYFDVADQCKICTSAENAPVQNMHGGSAENARVPVQNMHPKNKRVKVKDKKKNIIINKEPTTIDGINTFELARDILEGKIK
jgi:hypothetical protein